MRRIVCIGNRFVPGDDLGPLVCDWLRAQRLPAGVEVIDGGLGGLALLGLADGCTDLVFVDRARGFGAPGEVMVLEAGEVAALCDGDYGHAAGLPYVLSVLPRVHDGTLPRIAVLVVESGPGPVDVDRVATLALQLSIPGEEICREAAVRLG